MTSPVGLAWIALGITAEPTRRPADGRLAEQTFDAYPRDPLRLFIFSCHVTSKLANRIVTTELRCICVRAFESPTLHDCFYRRLAPLSRFNPAA